MDKYTAHTTLFSTVTAIRNCFPVLYYFQYFTFLCCVALLIHISVSVYATTEISRLDQTANNADILFFSIQTTCSSASDSSLLLSFFFDFFFLWNASNSVAGPKWTKNNISSSLVPSWKCSIGFYRATASTVTLLKHETMQKYTAYMTHKLS